MTQQGDIIQVTAENLQKVMLPKYRMTSLLVQAAFELGYAVEVYAGTPLFRVTDKKSSRSQLIYSIFPPHNPYAAAKVADNKFFTNLVLRMADVPSPRGVRVKRAQYKNGEWDHTTAHLPAVVKPASNTLKGKDVVTNITSHDDLKNYLDALFESHTTVLVEEYYTGMEDYRLLVVGDRVVGVLHRVRPYVIGDGQQTIGELIDAKNALREESTKITLGPIKIDFDLENKLKAQELTLESVPSKDQRVELKNICNLGAGGELEDATDVMCEENKELGVRATHILGLRLSGVDMMCVDPTVPITDGSGVIVEVNNRPDLIMHHYPHVGSARNVAYDIMKALFPES